jgi:Txe/YoeB family toxin of Txe-Axe toxin-antitoxin module
LRDFQILENKLKVKNIELDSKVQNLLKEMDRMAYGVKKNYDKLNEQCQKYGYKLHHLDQYELDDKKCPFLDNEIGLVSYPYDKNVEIFGFRDEHEEQDYISSNNPEIPRLQINFADNQRENAKIYPNGLPIIMPALNLNSTNLQNERDQGVLPTGL